MKTALVEPGESQILSRTDMMKEHLATLITARERMIEDRQPFAEILAGPFDRDKSERARSKFLELQGLIEAIERAIESERGSSQNFSTPDV